MGSLRVNVTTTGSPLDPDGYRVAFVEGDTLPSAPVGISDTVVYDSVQPGIFRVRLDSIAPSCSVVRISYPFVNVATTSIEIRAGLNTDVDFYVQCGVLPPGRIAFVLSPDAVSPDVYLMNTDGTDLIRVTLHGGAAPAWSADGHGLAFFCQDGAVGGLCRSNEDGSGLGRLTADSGVAPVWSRDGSRIAYECASSAGTAIDICVVGSDGSGRINLTSGVGFNTSPSWSPDGSRLVFARAIDTVIAGNPRPWDTIQLIDADGNNLHQLTPDSLAFDPERSPTSDFIAFVKEAGIDRVRSDGTEHTPLDIPSRGSDLRPAWSPDGTRIAFDRLVRKNSNVRDLWVMDADGGNLNQVTQFGAERPVWSSDGAHLTYTEYQGTNVYSVGVDGSDLTVLKAVAFPGFAGQPAWQP